MAYKNSFINVSKLTALQLPNFDKQNSHLGPTNGDGPFFNIKN